MYFYILMEQSNNFIHHDQFTGHVKDSVCEYSCIMSSVVLESMIVIVVLTRLQINYRNPLD